MHTEINTNKSFFFYTVISSRSQTIYHPESSTSPYLLQPKCAFSPHHVCAQVIDAHFDQFSARQSPCPRPSPFITLFDSFAAALTHAHHHHYTSSSPHILILRLSIPNLLPTLTQNAIPTSYSPHTNLHLLHMHAIAPYLDLNINPISTPTTRAAEYLSCGPIPRSALSAAWPVIGSCLYFEPGRGVDFRALVGEVCGFVGGDGDDDDDDDDDEGGERGEEVYDWEERAFVRGEQEESGEYGYGVVTGVGAERWGGGGGLLGCDGFLRGMRVMD
ncbi:hypothetical protein NX059_002769 [Plenodomus lindquistii]|nr:hypothetical protein NX059_002769 [Plenodomus lindquistii]